MSSQVSTASGYIPSINNFRLISPQVVVDATGGTGTFQANSTFNTNLPLGKGAAIHSIDWFVTFVGNTVPNIGHNSAGPAWRVIGQLTEALARTAPALTDPTYISDYLHEAALNEDQNTAGAVLFPWPEKAHWQDRPRGPWLTVAQQLNLIGQFVGDAAQNGAKLAFQVIIGYELVDLTQALNSYLATRLQITGQA